MARILFLMMFPFVCFSQITPREDIPVNNLLKEKENLDTKRKASYNLDEIKVRWKKAALENCPGVPCVVTPPPPSFTCGTSTVSDIDGNIYETVAIFGTTQCWTKTNLKVTTYNDGTLIPDLTTSTSNPWATSGALTEYVASGVTGYVGTFGYLYNWYAVNDSRKLCPSGWHVPTDAEWTIMIQQLDNTASATAVGVQSSTAGTVMKKNDALWTTNTGTNTSSFSALPGGFRDSGGFFSSVRFYAFFWSATEFASGRAWLRDLSYLNGDVSRFDDGKSFGASVRCLRD
jgi:uncharacterized protein (TIGR02145 family)